VRMMRVPAYAEAIAIGFRLRLFSMN